MTVGFALVGIFAGSAPAAKKPKSCTLLTASKISKVLDQPVSGPGEAGTLDIACDFDIGAGLGEPGGGMVIVEYYEKGPIASAVFQSLKAGLEGYKPPAARVPGTKVWWDGKAASIYKNGQLVSVSISFTNSDPPPETLQPQMVALVKGAAKKL